MVIMSGETDHLDGLARRAESGDRGAFDEILQACQGQLETWIKLRLGERLRRSVEPADIFQETMLRALRSAESFRWRGQRALANWLARIAENAIQEQVRRARRQAHAAIEEGPAETPVSPSHEQRRGERFERLQRALDALDPVSRRVVELSRLEGRSLADIAALVDRSPNAVALVLMRAMRKMRVHLGDTESLGLPDQSLRRDGGDGNDTGSL